MLGVPEIAGLHKKPPDRPAAIANKKHTAEFFYKADAILGEHVMQSIT